jgi:N-acyl-D-aspartate/D-glutamate deacylase
MRNPFAFAAFPSWKRVFADISKPAQAAVYADPAFRNAFREDLKKPMTFGNWSRVTVHEIQSGELKGYEGKTIADIAKAQGKDGVDALLDLTLAADLEIELTLSTFNHRVDRMKEILNNPAFLLGLGDGGAHVDMLCDSGYPTFLLGHWVREQQALTLEQGVARLTSEPADFFGIRDRGRIAQGLAADFAIFDPATVGSSNRGERRYDLPGGAKRMVMPSRGMRYTVVNGQCVFEEGALTDARAGVVLRS